MTFANPSSLVSTEWLAGNLDNPSVRIVDGTSHLPTARRNADEEFLERRIPGAIRFDIDDVKDPDSALAHMMPPAEIFAAKVGAMGISNETLVVVYDVYGLQSAGRVWWMFRTFGHSKVAILNGGLPKWLDEGRATDSGPVTAPGAVSYSAAMAAGKVRDLDAMRSNIDSKAELVLDARAAGRYTGEQPEPRAGMRSGHIPGSLSLPFTDLVEGPHREMKSADDIRTVLSDAGVDPSRPIAATCGSGVTACAIAFGLHLIGHDDVAIYDGSWSEWGARDDTPVATGSEAG